MKQNYFIMYLIIVGVQLLICNYFHVTAYITLSLLPCAILCMPTKIGPSSADRFRHRPNRGLPR